VEKKLYLVGTERVGERLFFDDGRVADERLYKDKKLHGIWRQYWPNGQLFAERPYRDGQMDGTFRFWDEKGKLLGESKIKNGTGVLTEYANLVARSHDKETPFRDGKVDGTEKFWAKFEGCVGIGCSVSAYKDGRLDGWEVTRDEDGTLLGYGFAKHGELHGVLRKFNRDGTPVAGYPRYRINGREVDEAAFVAAAKSDKVLAKALTYAPPQHEAVPESPSKIAAKRIAAEAKEDRQ
jgi:antitoxin component YwqK of YwqJK toxin-antitoxin module